MVLNINIEIKGTGTVEIADNLNSNEQKAAEYIAKLKSYFKLLGQNIPSVNSNQNKYEEIADTFHISFDKAVELMNTIEVSSVSGHLQDSFI